MAKLEELLSGKSLSTVNQIDKHNKAVAGKIFGNMITVATKKRMAMQLDGSRIKKIRVRLLSGNFWFTPYIYNNKLYLAHDWFICSGADVFGQNVNRVS